MQSSKKEMNENYRMVIGSNSYDQLILYTHIVNQKKGSLQKKSSIFCISIRFILYLRCI